MRQFGHLKCELAVRYAAIKLLFQFRALTHCFLQLKKRQAGRQETTHRKFDHHHHQRRFPRLPHNRRHCNKNLEDGGVAVRSKIKPPKNLCDRRTCELDNVALRVKTAHQKPAAHCVTNKLAQMFGIFFGFLIYLAFPLRCLCLLCLCIIIMCINTHMPES